MRRFVLLLSSILFLLGVSNVFAGVVIVTPTTTHSAVSDTKLSIGLRFEFGDTIETNIVGSVRHTHTDTSNVVTGGLVDIAIPIAPGGIDAPTIRLMGVIGSPDIQGIVGFGYDLAEELGVFGIGVQISHLEGGVHIDLSGDFAPYLGINSLGNPPSRTTTTTGGGGGGDAPT